MTDEFQNPQHRGPLGKTRQGLSSTLQSLTGSVEAAPSSLRSKALWLVIGLIILFAGISGYKYYAYKSEESRLAAERAAGPKVRSAKITQGVGEHQVIIVGETRPFQSATLYAKISGYLKTIPVDKGDVVKAGQILAQIESPETDEAYISAMADEKNKHAIWARTKSLFAKGLVSQQEADQAQADFEVAQAKLRSEATLKGYETLRAPFPGTITARYADPGALVQNATNSESSALPVVLISQVDRLRVDVFLDQRDAPYVSKEDAVVITMPEKPGFKINGQLARLSGELDSRTKMLLAEIDIPNANGTIVAGSFVQVALQIKSPAYLEAPVESLILRGDHAFLTGIKSDNILTYVPIQIASNDGQILRILSGPQLGDLVALNVGETIPEGGKVRPIIETPPPAPAAAPAPTAPAEKSK
jgi:RND family efflux transporter MFP subunit